MVFQKIKMKRFKEILIIFIFFTACGDLGKVLRNEKIKTTDEFLIKKKEALVLPPGYEEIPVPGTMNKKEITQKDKIKKILKVPKSETINTKSSSTENSILDKIKE